MTKLLSLDSLGSFCIFKYNKKDMTIKGKNLQAWQVESLLRLAENLEQIEKKANENTPEWAVDKYAFKFGFTHSYVSNIGSQIKDILESK